MSTAVVILAGGEGRRIGGRKPVRTMGGERLVDRAAANAAAYGAPLAIAVRDIGQIPDPPALLIRDAEPIEGPLAGLASALAFAAARGCGLVLTIAADMPFLPRDLETRLRAALRPDARAALASSGGRLHPAASLWLVEAAKEVENYVAAGKRSLRGFAEAVGFVEVEWPDRPFDPFFNINSEADLAEAERLAAL